MKRAQRFTRFLSILFIVIIVFMSIPKQVDALTFGGKIISSQYRTCYIYIGVAAVPFPLQVIRITRNGIPKTIVYTYYQSLLQLFGINTSLYNYYQFYRSGPSVLGTYVPVPIPWTNCPDLSPTNLILKIGTSLY